MMSDKLILKSIDNDIELARLYAQYWIAEATTGVCLNRRLYHGFEGPEYTNEEKVAESMETAKRHIERMAALIDQKKSILYKEDNDE
jgi:hypothetical protein